MARCRRGRGEGDEGLVERLLAEHGALVRRVAATYERDGTARQDLLQEILLALWRALPRFRGECSERTFVLRVAHNRAALFAWWNRRATWRAAGAAVEDAVRLARLRAERQLRTAAFVLWLYAIETAAVVAQLAWFDRLGPVALVALAAGGVVVAVWSAVTRRRLRGEVARIDAFVRDALGTGRVD